MSIKKNLKRPSTKDLYEKLIQKDRIALSKAITLVESQNSDHIVHATKLLDNCVSQSGNSIRIGITGTPGVGTSTFIEKIGLRFIEKGKRVAVLTIDPSSPKNQGSILGDKSRMDQLSHHPNAYVRSSPSRSTLGGTTDKTRETIVLCEAARYDVIIVETVGVGQSETEIIDMTDLLLLLTLPGAGDEIQGIKRGIVEVADIVVVNKIDKFKESVVKDTLNTFKFALHLKSEKPSHWSSIVRSCSAATEEGLDKIMEDVLDYFDLINENGFLLENRNRQTENWLLKKIEQEGLKEIRKRLSLFPSLKEYQENIHQKKISVQRAAVDILNSIIRN